MFVPVLMTFGALFGGFAALKAMALAVFWLNVAVNERVATRSARNYRLGINPEYQKVLFMYETQKETMFGAGDFSKFLYQRITPPAAELPAHMQHLAHEWCLNREEFERLSLMIRQDQFNTQVGTEWERLKNVLEQIEDRETQEEFRKLCYSGPVSYFYLDWVSKNRLADETFMATADALVAFSQQEQKEKA